MDKTPRALRLQIGFFGRVNAGKSTLFNLFAGQENSITSPIGGTTTDAVEKMMEFRPFGQVQLIDCAGFGDDSTLGKERMRRAGAIIDRVDIAILVVRQGAWGDMESDFVSASQRRSLPLIVAVNRTKDEVAAVDFIPESARQKIAAIIPVCAVDQAERDNFLDDFRSAVKAVAPQDLMKEPPMLRHLVAKGGTVILIVPIDLQAPKGRLILPQVQAIRDALDGDLAVVVVKQNQYVPMLKKLSGNVDLVVCDSQVVDFMVENTPENIPCTTFSILLAAMKGDIYTLARGAEAIKSLQDGDRVVIAESCTHHATCEDIGRVKIPALIRRATGKNPVFEIFSGHDFPEKFDNCKLVIHCGGCMIPRREYLHHLDIALSQGIPVTNYGVAISACRGVLKRVLSAF